MNIRTIAAVLLAATLAVPAFAQPAIDWHTIDGGGEMFSTSREYRLGGTIGQADAGTTASGAGFSVTGGFWVVTLAADVPPCPGDLDHDLDVDISDLATLLSNFGVAAGAEYEDGDLDLDGDVDISDLSQMLSLFGTICS